MKVFLDTNVLASAFTTRGLCSDVLRHVLASHTLLVSRTVLDELERVLRDKFGVPEGLVSDALALLRPDLVPEDVPSSRAPQVRSAADRRILGAAVAADADVFVTCDGELLKLYTAGPVAILSPRQFWDRAKARPDRAEHE